MRPRAWACTGYFRGSAAVPITVLERDIETRATGRVSHPEHPAGVNSKFGSEDWTGSVAGPAP